MVFCLLTGKEVGFWLFEWMGRGIEKGNDAGRRVVIFRRVGTGMQNSGAGNFTEFLTIFSPKGRFTERLVHRSE